MPMPTPSVSSRSALRSSISASSTGGGTSRHDRAMDTGSADVLRTRLEALADARRPARHDLHFGAIFLAGADELYARAGCTVGADAVDTRQSDTLELPDVLRSVGHARGRRQPRRRA